MDLVREELRGSSEQGEGEDEAAAEEAEDGDILWSHTFGRRSEGLTEIEEGETPVGGAVTSASSFLWKSR